MKAPILVTGAAGFIGARFVESCHGRGIPVISVDQLKAFDDRAEHRGIRFGEKIAIDALSARIREASFEVSGVVHCGACSSTTETRWDYLHENNVLYSQKLWDFCREREIPFVYASSAATYGAGEQGYEDDESRMPSLKPLNLYGRSKAEFDVWALAQERAGCAPRAWSGFKFFNVYGFGEAHKGAQASMVYHSYRQIQERGSVRLFKSEHPDYRDGEQKRDFVSVEDVVRVLHFALDRPLKRGIYNLGSGQARTWIDLVQAVFAAVGGAPKIEFIDLPETLKRQYQYFTQAKMNKLREAGFSAPFLSLEEGVRRTVARIAERA